MPFLWTNFPTSASLFPSTIARSPSALSFGDPAPLATLFHSLISQVRIVVRGEHIQPRLAHHIRRVRRFVIGIRGIRGNGDRTQARGDINQLRLLRFQEEWSEGLADHSWPDGVCLEGFAELVPEGLCVGNDARIVYENIHTAEVFLDRGYGIVDKFIICDVELNEGDGALRLLGLDLGYSFLSFLYGASADDDMV
jgi:hypothetical protein